MTSSERGGGVRDSDCHPCTTTSSQEQGGVLHCGVDKDWGKRIVFLLEREEISGYIK
jgi:hypothetical protein